MHQSPRVSGRVCDSIPPLYCPWPCQTVHGTMDSPKRGRFPLPWCSLTTAFQGWT